MCLTDKPTKLKKIVLLFFALLFLATQNTKAQEITPEMQAFLAKIDGANLEEIEAELDEGIKGLKAFAGFFDGPGSEGIKDYAPEEEKFEDPFTIDTSVVAKAILQFDNIGFRQQFRDGTSLVKFNKIGDDYWNTTWMEEGMTERFIPMAIYRKDGSNITDDIEGYDVSFFFEEPWGAMAVIDSIAIDYEIRYTAAYDSLVLTKKSKKINYKDGFIKVKKIEKNFLYLTISDAYADGFYVNALNAEGKVLNSNSSSFSPTSDDQADDGITEILKLLEEVQAKLKKKDFKDTEAFKRYLLKKVPKIEKAKDSDGVYHRKYYFEGNIDTVKIFIETEEESKSVSFMATNTSGFGEIILVQNGSYNIFLDANAKELFKLEYTPIQSLGSRYFQNDSLYYHLDLESKKLDALNVFRVWEASNGLAFIQTKKENGFQMYSSDYELLSEITFDDLYSINEMYTEGITNKEHYIIDANGKIKKLDGINDIRELFDGRMAAKSNGKYGYIDASGTIVIPFIYSEAENFKDGLAIVAQEANAYGLIDTNGKTVIPLNYFGVQSYENGIAWVSTGSGYELIDKTGKVLVTAKGSSYSVSGSGIDKTYQFGDKKYDAFGKLIPKVNGDK